LVLDHSEIVKAADLAPRRIEMLGEGVGPLGLDDDA
jgi:hypothetical protein